jgi:hypothetical protein
MQTGPIIIGENAGPVTFDEWVTNVSPGAGEVGEVSFTVSSDNPDLFLTGPSLDESGSLSFTTKKDVFGSSLVTITAADPQNLTMEKTFTITVTDVPVVNPPTPPTEEGFPVSFGEPLIFSEDFGNAFTFIDPNSGPDDLLIVDFTVEGDPDDPNGTVSFANGTTLTDGNTTLTKVALEATLAAGVVFTPSEGFSGSTTLTMTITNNAEESVTISEVSTTAVNTVTVDIVVEGPPDWVISGFFSPVDMSKVNLANAGRVIPIKWRILDSSNEPVSSLPDFEANYASTDCSDFDSSPTNTVVNYVSATSINSGPRYLGNGYWQFNWSTQKNFASECQLFTIDFGNGESETVRFQFSR